MSVFLHHGSASRALCLCALLCFASLAQTQEPPALMLASEYRQQIALDDYWISEKLDGVRAYWDGTRLVSRSGNTIHAPTWFTRNFPRLALDGELWIARLRFDEISGIARRAIPQDEDWREVKFMLFDLPQHGGSFDQRLAELQRIVAAEQIPWLQTVPQFRIDSHDALMLELERVTADGGEGLMLHRGSSLYHNLRNADLLKLKTHDDAEATVIAHQGGQGRLTGMMGSVLVEMDSGIRFRIGTGFSDAQRRDPPPIGSRITYQYSGFTARGVPRFARFLRIREDP
ncbi:MAG: DNA ligase [Gammaproteobacteria bacterium]|nr:DNA ligase [Gammaproteobacteria bacterium]MDP2141792.1 DNA ligase [Gammaproteobacteria bacterium]MDP2348014.1 DNA ligase [Gammaproteobacteria bacterium]